VQAVPAALGAMLARSQFGGDRPREQREAFSGYGGTIFMMLVGALFLGLNVAPTEEMVQIAYTMTPWHAAGLILVTVGVMHAFVYGHGTGDAGSPGWRLLLRYTFAGYVVALLVSVFVLWTFGRIDGVGSLPVLMSVVVLAFPAGLGAAAARLVL
jgi:putative integral membrane protein (TIGR02587 family)